MNDSTESLRKGKLNLNKFKCKLVGEIRLEDEDNKDIDPTLKVGHAWSGINVAVGSKQSVFLYGTDNGQIVRLKFVEEENWEKTQDPSKDSKDQLNTNGFDRKRFTYNK